MKAARYRMNTSISAHPMDAHEGVAAIRNALADLAQEAAIEHQATIDWSTLTIEGSCIESINGSGKVVEEYRTLFINVYAVAVQ